MSIKERAKRNFEEIKKGFQIKVLSKTLLFFCILGMVVPNFQDYFYYYQLDVVDFSKLTYALLQAIGNLGILVGAILYKDAVNAFGIRGMMVGACLVNLVGALGSLLFVEGITFGLSPVVFLGITGTLN